MNLHESGGNINNFILIMRVQLFIIITLINVLFSNIRHFFCSAIKMHIYVNLLHEAGVFQKSLCWVIFINKMATVRAININIALNTVIAVFF